MNYELLLQIWRVCLFVCLSVCWSRVGPRNRVLGTRKPHPLRPWKRHFVVSPGSLWNVGNIRHEPKLLGWWQQRFGRSLSVLQQLVSFLWPFLVFKFIYLNSCISGECTVQTRQTCYNKFATVVFKVLGTTSGGAVSIDVMLVVVAWCDV